MEIKKVTMEDGSKKSFTLEPGEYIETNGRKLYTCTGCFFDSEVHGCELPEGNPVCCLSHKRVDCQGKVYKEVA